MTGALRRRWQRWWRRRDRPVVRPVGAVVRATEPVPLPVEPGVRVCLGFRDGSVVQLAPGSDTSLALRAAAARVTGAA